MAARFVFGQAADSSRRGLRGLRIAVVREIDVNLDECPRNQSAHAEL